MNCAVRVENLTKTYSIFADRRLLAAQPLLLLTRNIRGHLLYALQDVSFEIGRGEIFGIIGHNGSGKSTLLKILSGITRADSGKVTMKGRVTSLLELGVGFEPELTGRENIYLYGALTGLSRQAVRDREEAIIRFSGIRDFIDTQVKTYSSGMLIRLAFSAAIHTDPDVLLLDEVLGVGDQEFQHRSFQAIQKLIERGATVVIVSHGLSLIGGFCDRVMCLNQGRVAGIGMAEEVVQVYMDKISAREKICEIGTERLRLRFLPAGFHIEHDGTVYTVARGISVNLVKWEADFLSSEASWTILEQNETSVVLQLRWGHWNLEQIWRVQIVDDTTIDWVIENGANLHLDVDSLQIEVMVSGCYREYILPEDIRLFPNTVNRGFNMEYLLAQQQPRRFMGVRAATDKRRALLFDFSANPLTGASMVITGGNLMPGHILKRNFASQSGQKPVHTRIHLFDESAMTRFYQAHRKKLVVRAGALTLGLENNCLMLYEKDIALSSLPGMHVAGDNLVSAVEYEWEDIECESGLHLRATDGCNPFAAIWRLNACDDTLNWSVELEILEKMYTGDLCVMLPMMAPPPDHIDFGVFESWNSETGTLVAGQSENETTRDGVFAGRLMLAHGVIKRKGNSRD